jgi:predicted RNase H-like HicB family nuclease
MTIEVDREEGGRWLAAVPELPGILTYGAERREAIAKAQALALRMMADRLEHCCASVENAALRFELTTICR